MAIEHISAAYSSELAELAQRLRGGVAQIQVGSRGIGTGILWRTSPVSGGAPGEVEATIITNAHVVRAAREPALTLRLSDGRELEGRVTAVDPSRDLASLTTRGTDLTPLEIGDSAALRVGELVLAVGNPFGRFNALTLGVVAARAPADPDLVVEPAETPEGDDPPSGPRDPRGRWRLSRLEVIQADIRLYPGNSGGPLTDVRGRVVGVNSMVGGGLAFAIPSRTVRQFLAEVEQVTTRPYLGVQVLSVPLPEASRQRHGIAQRGAALVASVEPESPADRAGLLVGDVILALNDVPVASAEQLPRALARVTAPDAALTLNILRGGEPRRLTLQPETRAAA
jgi:S1-C subfamily serine protease